MRVLIFGSTGLAGRYILAELLAQGHQVTAFVRSRDRIDPKLISSPHLTVVEGDVLTKADTNQAFATGEFDAVISSINEGLDIELQLQSKGTRLILDVIKRKKKNGHQCRFLVFAGAGMLDVPTENNNGTSQGQTQFWKYTSDYPAMYRAVSDEHETIYNMIRQERNLEWTLLCPPLILDEPADGQFLVAKGVFPSTKGQIKAGNLAQFIVKELTAREFVNERVGISDA